MPADNGAFKVLQGCFGQDIPFFALTFDKAGICQSPITSRKLIEVCRAEGASDVLLYAHGWNNDWNAANARFEGFLNAASAVAREQPSSLRDAFKPIFIGVFWPSTALTFSWEDPPEIAASVE